MQRIAIIDIGSNSARLVISHIYKSGSYNMVFNQKEMLRLAQKTEGDGLLSKEAFDSTLQVMQSFAYMCRQYKTDKIIAVATAAIRNARNGSQLAKEVFEKTGIRLHIISGNMEAQLSYLGVINTLPMKDGIVFDLGGGSTEQILFRNRKLVESVSIPLGAVNTTDVFHIRYTMPPSAYSDINFFISTRMEQYPWLKDANLPLIGVGGTAPRCSKNCRELRWKNAGTSPAFRKSAPTSFSPALPLSTACSHRRTANASLHQAAACAKACFMITMPERTACL